MEQERDFHVGLMRHNYIGVADRARQEFDLCEEMGEAEFRALVAHVRLSESYRREVADRLRRDFWIVRNTRRVDVPPCERPDSFDHAVDRITGWVQVLDAAGFGGEALRAYVECLAHGCTCQGCDLARGERFVKGEWAVRPFVVYVARGSGGEQRPG